MTELELEITKIQSYLRECQDKLFELRYRKNYNHNSVLLDELFNLVNSSAKSANKIDFLVDRDVLWQEIDNLQRIINKQD